MAQAGGIVKSFLHMRYAVVVTVLDVGPVQVWVYQVVFTTQGAAGEVCGQDSDTLGWVWCVLRVRSAR